MDFNDVFKDGSILFMRTTREVEWDAVEIQTLLILSFGAQVIFTFFGNRGKYRLRSLSRLVLWLSYLTASPMVTLLLGKLSGIAVTAYDVQGSYKLLPNHRYGEYGYLVNSWAPLLFVQICSPNMISYSVEDNKLTLRQAFGLTSQEAIALWIFYQSLFVEDAPYTAALSLYVSGIIKVGERLRVLWSLSNSENVVITSFANSDIRKVENTINPSSCSNNLVSGIYSHDLSLLVKAYQRFDRLSIYLPSMSVDDYLPNDVFRITEFELSFMYDVLYTKALINYSKISFCGRIIFILILSFALYTLRHDEVDSIIIIVSLAGAIVLDLYLIMELLFSDWVILHLMKQNRGAFTRRLLIIVARKIPIKKHRWSHCMDEFNLLSYCLHEEPTKLGRLIRRILKIKGYYKEYKKSCVKKDIQVPEELKKLLLQQREEVRAQRGWQSFSKMGEWALERYNCLPDFEWTIQTDFGTQANKQTNFGKAIIIWHIATNLCYPLDDGQSQGSITHSQCEMSKVLSNYMMYLLAMHHDMLSIVTGDILFHSVCAQVGEFLKIKQSKDEATLCRILVEELVDENYFQGIPKNNVLTSDWNVLLQVQKLVGKLREREDRWRIISSVWVEMLFCGASNCPWTLHAEQLRRGGELLTHVWLMLKYEKDKSDILSRELQSVA